jgi:hypothetical protein
MERVAYRVFEDRDFLPFEGLGPWYIVVMIEGQIAPSAYICL